MGVLQRAVSDLSVEQAMQAQTPQHAHGSGRLVNLHITEAANPVRQVLLALESLGNGQGVVLAANRPAHMLRTALLSEGLDLRTTHFLDCVSSLSGIAPRPEPGIHHVESPTMLEKIAMRCEQMLRAMPAPRHLTVDSLSALAVYNGPDAVVEFAHHLINRLRALDVPAVFLVSDRAVDQNLREAVAQLCDGVHRA